MRQLAVLVSIAALAVPLAVYAAGSTDLTTQMNALLQQLSALEAQLTAMQSSTSQSSSASVNSAAATPTATTSAEQCMFSRTLSPGDSGVDVFSLQQYLIAQGLLSADSATGYFGAMTEAALGTWQADNGIVSSGTPATTGFGAFGTRTWTAMQKACTGGTVNLSCPSYTPPQENECQGTWSVIKKANGCAASWRCTMISVSTTPTVSPPASSNTCGSAVSLSCPTGSLLQVNAQCQQSCVLSAASAEGPATYDIAPFSGHTPVSVTFLASDVPFGVYTANFGDGTKAQMTSVSCTIDGRVCTYRALHGYSTAGAFTATIVDVNGNTLEKEALTFF
jgi:peptidoglycan hydrolase-like protein with peptidoglycan-binding domain